jgi:hypothetical protein
MERNGVVRSLWTVCGFAMVVAFFAPWVDFFGLAHASGLALATSDDGGWKRHLLWMYPAGGAALALFALRGDGRARNVAVLLGGAVVGLAIYDTASGLVDNLRYGAWLTVGGAIIAAACGLTKGDRAWSVIGGALVVIGFFLPWLGDGRAALSGYDLAQLSTAPDPLPSPKWLYLVPLLGALAAFSAFTARGRILSLVGGAGVLGLLAYLYLQSLNMVLGWGAWLTFLAGVGALAGALLVTSHVGRRRGAIAA